MQMPVFQSRRSLRQSDDLGVSGRILQLLSLVICPGDDTILTDDDRYLTSICNRIHTLAQGRLTASYNPDDERRLDMPFKIPARLEDKVALVNPSDIFFVVAEQSRTFLQTTEGRLPTQFTLTELEQRLSRSGFFRAHRAYLVNLQHVTEVIPYTRNSFSLRLGDGEGTKIPLSKSTAAELRELLGY